MTLSVLPDDLTVCQVSSLSAVDLSADLFFLGKAAGELSLVCRTADVPEGVCAREDGWRGLVVEGVLDFSLVGILAGLTAVLAEKGIGLFALSTYNTDYLLVKAESLPRAAEALTAAGYTVHHP